MKKIIEHRYFEYLKNLLEQYKGVVGARKISLDDLLNASVCSEFSNWLDERKENTEDYRAIINSITDTRTRMASGVYLDNHVYDLFDTCEIGKGPSDSLANGFNSVIVSPVADLFDKSYGKKYVGDLKVSYGRPYIEKKDGTIVKTNGINTYMTQNPYDFSSVYGLEDIHNSGRGRVIFGVYGSIYDKDKSQKLKEFKNFADRFTVSPNGKYYAYIIDGKAFGGKTYYALLISKNTNNLNKYNFDLRSEYAKKDNERILRDVKRLKRGK